MLANTLTLNAFFVPLLMAWLAKVTADVAHDIRKGSSPGSICLVLFLARTG